MDIITGNLDDVVASNPDRRGWFAGVFADAPYQQDAFEIKWSNHTAGEKKETPPIEDAETISILLSGRFRTDFKEKSITMEKIGDYVYYGKGVWHSWEAIEDSRLITIRWPSIDRKNQPNSIVAGGLSEIR